MKKKLLVLMSCALLQSCTTQMAGYAALNENAIVSGYGAAPTADSQTIQVQEQPNHNQHIADRTVIYKADINLLVDDHTEADKEIRRNAKALGGWFQTRNDRFLILRIPAKKFEGFIASLGELGTVISRSIHAEDITEQFLDVELRLENANKTLGRLRLLYSKAKDVKEILLIENEINRISETIEAFKGKLKYWTQQAAYSTVKININQSVERSVAYDSPFSWMEGLGAGLKGTLRAGEISPFWSKISVIWPEECVALSHGKYHCEAMTADGLFLSFSVREVETKAPLNFWASQAKNVLEKTRLIRISKEEKVSLANGVEGRLLQGSHGKTGYVLVLSSKKGSVATIEVRGPQEVLAKHGSTIRKILQNTEF